MSVEDQRRADERIPELLATPAAVRFVSCEPLLGPIDLGRYLSLPDVDAHCRRCGAFVFDLEPGDHPCVPDSALGWIIVGGESGPGARPMDIAWARSLVTQSKGAGVPVFVKQLGAHPASACKSHGLSCGGHPWPWNQTEAQARGEEPRPPWDRKGGDMSQWPADLRVREFPR